jgi:hypothetical protein
MKMETEIIPSITATPIGRAVILVIMYDDSISIEDLVTCSHFDITLENSHHTSCLIIDIIACNDKRKNVQVIDLTINNNVSFQDLDIHYH